MSALLFWAVAALAMVPTPAPEAAGAAPSDAMPSVAEPLDALERDIQRVEVLLSQWQFEPARALAERLLADHPDLPAVQFAAGWVKFHLGEHATAAQLVDRAARAVGPRLERDPRVARVRAMARITAGFVRHESTSGKVIVTHPPGPDRILVPDLITTVERTIEVVGGDLGHTPSHPILVQVLPDADALAAATGLTADEIRTSGTIAVCKFGRLMITSPRTTLKGYSYLDTASHELVHLIISEKTRNRTPIWIHEALAKYEDSRWRAGEPLYKPGLSPRRQSALARAIAAGKLITFEQMHPSMALLPSQEAADLAFTEVYTVTSFLLSLKGYAGIRRLLELLGEGRGDMQAIEEVYGLSQDKFVAAWLGFLASQDLMVLVGSMGGLQADADTDRSSAGERKLARAKRVDLRDHFHLGQLLRARGKTKAALVEYEQARRKAGPRHAALWVITDKLGQVLAAVGRKEEAKSVFKVSLDMNPDDLEAHYHLGRLLSADDPWRAFLHLREASRLNPLDPRVHLGLVAVCKRLAEQNDTRFDFASLAAHHRLAYRVVRQIERQAPSEPEPAGLAEATATARLRIHSRPWARVWLDFVDTGLTTPVLDLPVAPGRHVVSLASECSSEPEVRWVRVEAGQTEVIDVKLCPAEAPGAPAGLDVAR